MYHVKYLTQLFGFFQINVDHKTVAVSSVAQNAGFSNPLSTPIDALRVVGNVVANVNAMDAAVARQESSGSNCMNFPTAEARVGDAGLLQPADNVPFVHPNVEEGTRVRNKEVAMNLLCCTGKKGSKASLVEPMEINLGDENTLQNGESPVLCELGDAGEEVEEHEEVHSDAEQVRAQDGHVEACLDEDNIVKDTGEERIEEEQVEQLEDQVKVVSNIREIGVDFEAVNGVEPHALVAGGVGSSGKNDCFKLWQGHAVYPECVDLLELIRKTYPETFKGFSPQSKMIYTVGLFTLYTAVKSFSNVSTVEVTAATITKYRGLFADLERWGFNINWLVNHLNCIEQLRFSRPLVDELHVIDRHLEEAQREVRELQSLRSAKVGEIQEAFGHLGTHLAAGCLGDGLFPDH